MSFDLYLFGFVLEYAYYIVSRILLAFLYLKTMDVSICKRLSFLSLKTLITVAPCDMLLFFCYRDKKRNLSDYAAGMLNLAWLRRIVSSLRLII